MDIENLKKLKVGDIIETMSEDYIRANCKSFIDIIENNGYYPKDIKHNSPIFMPHMAMAFLGKKFTISKINIYYDYASIKVKEETYFDTLPGWCILRKVDN